MENKNKERKIDEFNEQLIAKYLDLYFYSKISSVKTQRIINKEMQVQGVDIIMTLKDVIKYIDEKAATDKKYLDGSLQRFCVEITTLNRIGKLIEGWFINSNLLTTHYLFVWIREVKDKKLTCLEDIKKIEVCLVPKYKIEQYLLKKGWTKERLLEKAYNIRYNGDRKFFEDGVKFYFSERKDEQPIGATLPIYVYKNMADLHYTITPEFIY